MTLFDQPYGKVLTVVLGCVCLGRFDARGGDLEGAGGRPSGNGWNRGLRGRLSGDDSIQQNNIKLN